MISYRRSTRWPEDGGSGVDEMRKGEELMQAMKAAAADSYTSFLGLPDGAHGRVSFLFKLDGVSKE